MTIEEIFAKLKAHALEGLVFPDEMVRYYDFLSLDGYKECHEYHYAEESKAYRKLCSYYMDHYNRLIPTQPMSRPDVIPDSWYNYSRQDVDPGTKASGVKTAIEKWVSWEKRTKQLYEEMCEELLSLAEIAAADFLMCYVRDVDDELKYAMTKHLALEAAGYDMKFILSEQ